MNSRGKKGWAASPSNASFPLTHVGKTSMSMSLHDFKLPGSAFWKSASNFGSKFWYTVKSFSIEA
jgi:hypothetical protein